MFRGSKDSPVYYLTSVTNNRLPVFQTVKLKDLVCDALNEARKSAGLLFFAYVIMPDHLHALIGSDRKPSEVVRFVNGIAARVRAGLVERAQDYRWSSVRCWMRKPLDDEPLVMDLDQIDWHRR